MDKYIGFDIAYKKTVACIVQKGKPDKYDTLPTDVKVMRQWLDQQRKSSDRLHLTFEVSGQSGWLYDALRDRVDSLAVSNPSQMTWIYRTAKKTDRIDARKQAVLYMMDELPRVHMPGKEIRQWRQQIQHRRNVCNLVTQTKNRTRALLRSQGIQRPAFKMGWWSLANRYWMRQLAGEDTDSWHVVLADLLDQLELYEKQLKRITKQLDQRLQDHPAAVVLLTIPGVGPRTTEAVLAYTDEVERFRRGKQYCAYFGVTPRLDESGSFRRLGHISKQGPSVVRWLVVESAWRAIQYSPALLHFYERIKRGQEKRKKIAIVATARKLLSIMRAMLITGEGFNEKLVLQQEHWHHCK